MAIAAGAFIAIAALQLPFPLIVLAAALLGMAGGRSAAEPFSYGDTQHGGAARYGAALIDDDTPTPEHAQLKWPRLLGTAAVGLALAFITWLEPGAAGRVDQPLAQMGVFFSKAALLTFGGAYACCPTWCRRPPPLPLDHERADGWMAWRWAKRRPAFDHDRRLHRFCRRLEPCRGRRAPVAGGRLWRARRQLVHLPALVHLHPGRAPLVEASRGNLRLSAPLTAISAAVVGVIASLALFFGRHVFWQENPLPHWDWLAMLIALAAGVALIRFQVGTIKLLLACAIFGLVLSYLP